MDPSEEHVKYQTLYDRSGKKRAIVCTYYEGVGISFKSDDDKWNEQTGKYVARNRALRALRLRKPCHVKRNRVFDYIINLRHDSLAFLMKLTEYQLRNFPKSFLHVDGERFDIDNYNE